MQGHRSGETRRLLLTPPLIPSCDRISKAIAYIRQAVSFGPDMGVNRVPRVTIRTFAKDVQLTNEKRKCRLCCGNSGIKVWRLDDKVDEAPSFLRVQCLVSPGNAKESFENSEFRHARNEMVADRQFALGCGFNRYEL